METNKEIVEKAVLNPGFEFKRDAAALVISIDPASISEK